MKVVGERALGGQVDALDDLRKAKVMEAFEKAEVKYKGKGAASKPAAVSAPPAAVPKLKSVGGFLVVCCSFTDRNHQ
jgi:hypothetical protein